MSSANSFEPVVTEHLDLAMQLVDACYAKDTVAKSRFIIALHANIDSWIKRIRNLVSFLVVSRMEDALKSTFLTEISLIEAMTNCQCENKTSQCCKDAVKSSDCYQSIKESQKLTVTGLNMFLGNAQMWDSLLTDQLDALMNFILINVDENREACFETGKNLSSTLDSYIFQ